MNHTIRLKGIVFEDFINYKKPSMFLSTIQCNWKCCIEQGLDTSICQNQPLALAEVKTYSIETIIEEYLKNDISSAVVFGGLEPLLQFVELIDFIEIFRHYSDDDIVIYTGYYEQEIIEALNKLKEYKNIIVKFGRFIPNHKYHYDDVLGIELASDNQYAKQIS